MNKLIIINSLQRERASLAKTWLDKLLLCYWLHRYIASKHSSLPAPNIDMFEQTPKDKKANKLNDQIRALKSLYKSRDELTKHHSAAF